MVGAAAASAIALKEIVHDIVLIDIAEDLARGQAMDINHSAAYTNAVNVRAGNYSEIAEHDIVVITSGVPQAPGQSRRELITANANIVTNVVGQVTATTKPAFIIVVANPVDVLTQIALQASGLPPERVFGTGTTLDTARLRMALAQALHVSPQQVQAYVLGEHGDSSFPALSAANVAGIPLAEFPGFKPELTANIQDDIRAAAYNIIAAKKSTYFGIGHVIAKLVEALLAPSGMVYPVCSLTTGQYGIRDVVIGLPALVNNEGANILENYPLSEAELKLLRHSAGIVRSGFSEVSKPPEARTPE